MTTRSHSDNPAIRRRVYGPDRLIRSLRRERIHLTLPLGTGLRVGACTGV